LRLREEWHISGTSLWHNPNNLKTSCRPTVSRRNLKVAAILSVVERRHRLQVPVRNYLSTILPGLARFPIRCLPALLPLCGSPGIHRRKRTGY
jgi:hypothetical protein